MTKRRRAARFLLAGICAVAGSLALSAGPASAAEKLIYQTSFDGSKTPAGSFTAGNIAIDRQTDHLYVADPSHGAIHKFDLAGNPVDFSGTGSPTLTVPGAFIPASGFNGSRGAAGLAVDNSGTASQGNVYLLFAGVAVWGFGPDGKSLGPNWPRPQGDGYLCGLTVAPSGNVYTNTIQNGNGLQWFTPAGAPAGSVEIDSSGCTIAFDDDGHLYAGSLFSPIKKYDAAKGYAELGTIGETHGPQFALEPSTQDIYIDQGSSDVGKTIVGVRHTDPLVENSTFETLTGFKSGGLAFAANGDLYVAEGKKIDVFHRQPTSAPIVKGQSVSKVRSTSAFLDTQLVAAGSATRYHLEFGRDTSYGTILPPTDREIGNDAVPLQTSDPVEGLTPGTTYHFRIVATNADGVTKGPDRSFTTFPTPPQGTDPCANALARKQTGARFLLDCRAYELVSAADTDGYDVESSLVADQKPFGGFPLAADPPKVLYAIHAGAIPGLGNPTNLGPDPYVATRGPEGWSTKYVGLPADLNPQAGPFSSVLGGADAQLNTFAFAGPGICSPCFSSGIETGIPVRLPDGSLVQGMAGSLDPGAAAKPEGRIAKYFSADGTHLIFGSKARFEPDANGNGADLTIYDRNLRTLSTQVVSKTPSGATMTGSQIAELDVSADGSRIVVGRHVSTDGAGNERWRPYMHIGASPNTVDLAPGATDGVLFAGMVADGSKVFYSTADSLLPNDSDAGADIYEAAVDSAGQLSLRILTPSSAAGCDPVPNLDGPDWNSVGAGPGCDAVAIAGGGGVASAGGTVYFLSPEQLDGSAGSADEPNLYRAAPGQAPKFVATLEPDNPLVRNSVAAAETRRTADFQVTPSGDYAVFGSSLALTGVSNSGFSSIYRYDASSGQMACPSCDPTGAEDPLLGSDARLAQNGLSLTDDGRVFFTTRTPLVLNDTGERDDVYEWAGTDPKLISSGIGSFDSGLLSAGANGVDVYFFTHDKLSPEGREGTQTRIYDARSGGGFFALPVAPQCSASDECHGAGTVAPGPADIRTAVPGSDQNRPRKAACKKGFVKKKKGKCVKKKSQKKKSQKKRKAHKNA